MSLTRFAVRLCTTRALRGATLAEGRVFESVIDPLDQKVGANRAPMLIVNTEEHMQSGDGRDMTGGQDQLELLIEATIASRATAPSMDGDGEEAVIEIPHADEGMDLTLDLLEHQTIRTLMKGQGVWPSLWRRFVIDVQRRQSRRGADSTSGVKFAVRQMMIVCDVVAEPLGGEALEPGSVWGDFIAAVEADAGLAPLAGLLRSFLAGDGPDWVRAASMIGVSVETLGMIGAAPTVTDEAGQPVNLAEVELFQPPVVTSTGGNAL